jgi:hypothetical protein
MIFSRGTRLMAIVVLLWGVVNALLGVGFASGVLVVPSDIGLKFSPAGQMIDKGIYAVLVGLALGTLAEIALAVRRETPG